MGITPLLYQSCKKFGKSGEKLVPIALDDFWEVGTDMAGPRCHLFYCKLQDHRHIIVTTILVILVTVFSFLPFARRVRTKPFVASALENLQPENFQRQLN